MKLLVINPNISHSVTALIAAEARRAASPGTEIMPVTAPFGVAYIETVSEATIGAYAAMTLYAEHGADCDAVLIAAFGDPGLAAVREIAPVPVIGIAQAAFAAAREIGPRFSIVAISAQGVVAGAGRAGRASCGRVGRANRVPAAKSSPLQAMRSSRRGRQSIPYAGGRLIRNSLLRTSRATTDSRPNERTASPGILT